MEWLSDLVDYLAGFIHFLSFLFYSIYNFFDDLIRYILKALAKMIFWFSYQAMLASSELVDELMEDFNISSQLNSAWGNIPARERQMLAFFKVPEIVNTIFSAVSSRFVMRYVPASGV